MNVLEFLVEIRWAVAITIMFLYFMRFVKHNQQTQFAEKVIKSLKDEIIRELEAKKKDKPIMNNEDFSKALDDFAGDELLQKYN